MDTEPPVYKRFPRVGLGRRAAAFIVDYWVVSLLSSLAGDANRPGIELSQAILFVILWLGMRGILAMVNQGQSLGRWAFDMKLIETRFGRRPLLLDLAKREAIAGLGALLAAVGLTNVSPGDGTGILFLLPLAIDCSATLSDPMLQRTLHDRAAGTMVVATRRGFSLDLKLKHGYFKLRQAIDRQLQNRGRGDR
jgi:uncharacterized RDD family membrane protein YckC